MKKKLPAISVFGILLIIIGIGFAMSQLSQPSQSNLDTVTGYANAGQITALDLSNTTLTVTTGNSRVRVEGVTQEQFAALLAVANAHSNPRVSVSLAPDAGYSLRQSGVYLIPLLAVLAVVAFFAIKRVRRVNI
jgi:hypothetical protein